ncbi:MAG TPA: histidine-type phosphatase [Caulobacteraceae bacterium]|jgi:4-phytase/acid phosphatase|nr:histidine-type phosphatase [Caulobacteraceae bacterium]
MNRPAFAIAAVLLAALALVAGAAEAAPLHLVRVVLVTRHGVRPPTQSNAELAKYADKPWPDWPVAPGELTPHGGETVKLVADTVRETYRSAGLLPKHGCAGAGEVTTWADGADQRTRESGRIFAEAVQPGCGAAAPFADTHPRDPIFGGSDKGVCQIDAGELKAAMAAAAIDPSVTAIDVGPATARLQAIYAPDACKGGAGTCFTPADNASTPQTRAFPAAGSLAEDLLLEYGDGKPMSDVGWGRATAADIAAVMPLHERVYAQMRATPPVVFHRGAPMARVILAALAGRPAAGGPQSGPTLKLLTLSGHDTNIALMGAVFGVKPWTLPGQPDGTAPASALAFELWSDGQRQYLRPVMFYETLDQLRTLQPATARMLPLSFSQCGAPGPNGSCGLGEVARRVEARLPANCPPT